MCRSLCTVALDLAVCPHGPDTRLKLNYRLVAPGPKRGLFGFPLSESTHSLIRGLEKMSWDLRKKMPVLKTFYFFWCWIHWSTKTKMSAEVSKSYREGMRDRGPVEIGSWFVIKTGSWNKTKTNKLKSGKKIKSIRRNSDEAAPQQTSCLVHCWMYTLEIKKSFLWDKRSKCQVLINLKVCQAFHNP